MDFAEKLVDYYNVAIENSDPRTRDWFLVWNSPVAVLTLFIFYLLIVFYGKRFMKNRQEFNIPTYVLFIYNIGLVILSAYMLFELIMGIYQSKYDIFCAKLNVSYAKEEMRVTKALWLYFVSKAIEFFDTFFMIARKKFNQITFLHCFHHSSMLLIWWVVIMWIPGGQSYFGATCNSFIHVFMYLYYALSTIPSLKDKLWWKKYLTSLQLLQFFLAFFHVINGLVRGCDYPKWSQYLLTVYMIMMIVLFMNFYIHEYIQKNNKRKSMKHLNGDAKKLNGNHNIDRKTNGNYNNVMNSKKSN